MKKNIGNLEFGHLLKELRNQAELKQKTLAQIVHCADSEISRFERGKKLPPPPLLHSIVTALKQRKTDIAEEDIQQLWNLAGYVQAPGTWQETPPANPTILLLNQLAIEMYDRKIQHELIDKTMEQAQIIGEANLNILIAEDALKEREWKKSIELLTDINARITRLEELYARLYSAQAQAFYGDGNYLNAINYYNQALQSWYNLEVVTIDSSQKDFIQYQIGDTLINIGSVYRRKSQMPMADDYYKQAEDIFVKLNGPEAKEMLSNSLRKRAGIANYLGKATEAINLLENVKLLNVDFEDISPIVRYKNWQHLAWSYRLLGRWEEAIDLNNKALELIQQQDPIDKWEVMKAHIYLGESYRLIRNGDLAKEHYEEAQRILNSIQDEGRHAKLQEGMILLGLGRVYLKQPTQLHLAEKHLMNSLQMHYQLGEELMVAAVQNELGELHNANDEFEQALDFLLQARDYFKRISADFYYLSCQASLCKCYYRGRNYFKGRKAYLKIYEIVEETKNVIDAQMQTHLAKIKLLAGRASLQEENMENASVFFCESLNHAINFNKHIFLEVWDEISEDITNLAREGKAQYALSALHTNKTYIEQAEWKNEQSLLAKELIAKIKSKENEIKMLISHGQKQVANNSGG